MSQWLKKYYGSEYDFMNPQVVFEGEKKAVVKLTKTGARGFSGVGYVLIEKNGRHSVSSHKSLHEGMPTQADLDRMQALLKKEDQ